MKNNRHHTRADSPFRYRLASCSCVATGYERFNAIHNMNNVVQSWQCVILDTLRLCLDDENVSPLALSYDTLLGVKTFHQNSPSIQALGSTVITFA